MSNEAITNYCIVGDREQLKSLYDTMHSLELSKTPLKEDIIDTQSLENLAVALGADYRRIFCRGSWYDLKFSDDGTRLTFRIESFNRRPEVIEKLIFNRYPDLEFFFNCSIPDIWIYYTNDVNGEYFPNRFVIDVNNYPSLLDFKYKHDAIAYIESLIGRELKEGEDPDLALRSWGEAKGLFTRFFEYELVDPSLDPYHSY